MESDKIRESEMVSLNINGKDVMVPDGTTVLRAAKQARITIPRLCDHPHLTPHGSCRICIVEAEGVAHAQPACSLPARDGMRIHTA